MRKLTVKINEEEYQHLQSQQGESINAKVRNLLHQDAISAEISRRVTEQVTGAVSSQITHDLEAVTHRLEQMEQNISSISQSEQEVDTRLVQLGKEIRRLRKDLGKGK